MHPSTFLPLLTLTTLVLAQSTVEGISQISDGQIQAPPSDAPSVSIPSGPGPEIISTTLPNATPLTSYLTMPNPEGVTTDMPSAVTTQPPLVTSQPANPTLPTASGYYYNSTTLSTSEVATPSIGVPPVSSAVDTAATQTGPQFTQSTEFTGGADSNRLAGCGVAMIVVGLGFSML